MGIEGFLGAVVTGLCVFVLGRYYFRSEDKVRSFLTRIGRTSSGGFRKIRHTSDRFSVVVELRFGEQIANLPLEPRVLIVREGPDSHELLNQVQRFQRQGTLYSTEVSYPTMTGLQFKCFVDWIGPQDETPTLGQMRALLEQNGWTDIAPDGLHKTRFWFILPEFATKLTEDKNQYLNNWFPAGPPPSRMEEC